MDVCLDSKQVLTKHVHLVQGHLFSLAFLLTNHVDAFIVFIFVQLWYVTGVKHIVDILEHLLVDNLCVDE